jgi:hypothetical protein
VITFRSDLTFIRPARAGWDIDLSRFSANEIESEPMFHASGFEFVRKHAGPITSTVLDLLQESDPMFDPARVSIDTRALMLFADQYPAIGGWHCDGVPRGFDGQPDLRELNRDDAKLWTFTASSTDRPLCRTEFIDHGFEVDVDLGRGPGNVWTRVHAETRRTLVQDQGDRAGVVSLDDGIFARFSRSTLHRATKVEWPRSGWRFFFRAMEIPRLEQEYRPGASSWSWREPPSGGKIRKQVQVYVSAEGLGW